MGNDGGLGGGPTLLELLRFVVRMLRDFTINVKISKAKVEEKV